MIAPPVASRLTVRQAVAALVKCDRICPPACTTGSNDIMRSASRAPALPCPHPTLQYKSGLPRRTSGRQTFPYALCRQQCNTENRASNCTARLTILAPYSYCTVLFGLAQPSEARCTAAVPMLATSGPNKFIGSSFGPSASSNTIQPMRLPCQLQLLSDLKPPPVY